MTLFRGEEIIGHFEITNLDWSSAGSAWIVAHNWR